MAVGAGPSGSSGIGLYIGTTATVAATDTYTRVGSVETLSEYGIAYDKIVFEDLTLGTETIFKGTRRDGELTMGLGWDLSDSGQSAMLAALLTTSLYNFKVLYNDAVPVRSATATITIASPGVVTWTAHQLLVNTPVSFSTTGALPTGLVAATTYYVKTVVDANTFTLSATAGGTVIATTGTQSGVHTISTVPAATFDLFTARPMSMKVNPGSLSTVVKATTMLALKAGTLATTNRIPQVAL